MFGGREHGALGPSSIGLILRSDDGNRLAGLTLDKHDLGVVLSKVDRIKAIGHEVLEPHGLSRGFEVGQQHRVSHQAFALEIQEAGQKLLTRGKSGNINIGTPDLPENPSQQAERVNAATQIGLQRALTQRFQKIWNCPVHHQIGY